MKKEPKLYREDGTEAGFHDMITWWLYYYRGLEHFFFNPQIAYTITSILERSMAQIKAHRVDTKKLLAKRKPRTKKK